MRCDLHTHSTASDGTDTPTRMINNAVAAGLDLVALCDHDTFAGIDEASAAATAAGIGFLAGLEMSARQDGCSIHLLGYGCDVSYRLLLDELACIRESRSGRLAAMSEKLAMARVPVTVDEILAQAGDSPSVGRPHVADALVAKGYVKDRKEAFDSYIDDGGPCYVDRYATPLAEAIDLIHGAGGVAVIAHPWGRKSREALPPSLLAELVREHGLDGIEIDHPDHDDATRAELRQLGTELGLIVTGSSDYHGAGKPDNPLGINTTDRPMLLRILAAIAARGSSRAACAEG